MKKLVIRAAILPMIVASSIPAFSATPMNLRHQSPAVITSISALAVQFAEKNRAADLNNTLHVRIQQMYAGYPVVGADAVLHMPKQGANKAPVSTLMKTARQSGATMNGIIYQDLANDLANAPAYIFNSAQKEKAIAHAISLHQAKSGIKSGVKDQRSDLLVYVDKNNKAHWAYRASFFTATGKHAAKPAYIMDAVSFDVYKNWNDLKTLDDVNAGGFGGNHKTGKLVFDGAQGNLPALNVQRDSDMRVCYLQNASMLVRDSRNDGTTMRMACEKTDPAHNNVYWDADNDATNGAWSPGHDVLFGAKVTNDMFQGWYHIPPLVQSDGKPMIIDASVHDPMENAYWSDDHVVFGDSDGSDMFNPFTSLDTVAHEIGHGFTQQHADLAYYEQSGGLNEAFSDMAGIAAEFYAYGKTDYLVGFGDMKAEGKALRYMEKPSMDCEPGQQPGDYCSIDTMAQYNDGIDVHYTSGIFNRVYYTMAHSAGWDAHKAFDVMVQANRYHWTANTTYAEAACGVMKAAEDLHYDANVVKAALAVVAIDTKGC